MVWKLDRLGRSVRDLITMLDDLKGRGVKFRSLADRNGNTGRPKIGALAELERRLISEPIRAE